MRRSDFHYELPARLIAQHPPAERGDSRLLHLDGESGRIEDGRFADLVSLVNEGDLMVFNDTKVLPARLKGRKDTGGQVEVLVERLLDERQILAQVRASKTPRPGTRLIFAADIVLTVERREEEFFVLRLETSAPGNTPSLMSILERIGSMPLPPYIQRDAQAQDVRRYQTVFAQRPGAVAAPTAGLHFTDALLARLRDHGVQLAYLTLHVGAGTFQPVRSDDLDAHRMHKEWIEVNAALVDQIRATHEQGGRIIAVGTTVVRSLEAAALHGELQAYCGDTDIFIKPGFRFKVVDALVTNFHLPESTLLMLVSAFAGYDHIMNAYRHAVAQEYRFFSYGDAMFIERHRQS